jgi:hypothetical protein
VTGATNGNGHSSSFFLIASACSGIEDDDDDGVDNSEDDDYSSSSSSISSVASTGVGATGTITNLLSGDCNVVKVSLNGGGNSLSLTALGKIYDSNGAGLYSVWRIRNSTNSSLNARLVGYPSTTILNSLSASASYDYIVRSSFVSGAATHVLTNLSSLATSTKAASSSTYSDSSTGLCVQ